jgi:membrane glycosyltransferase
LSSRKETGLAARRAGFFLTPEETATPIELQELAIFHEENEHQHRPLALAKEKGFIRAVLDPRTFLLRLSIIDRPGRKPAPDPLIKQRKALVERALTKGPETLNRFEKTAILSDPYILRLIHRHAWSLPADILRRKWGISPN